MKRQKKNKYIQRQRREFHEEKSHESFFTRSKYSYVAAKEELFLGQIKGTKFGQFAI